MIEKVSASNRGSVFGDGRSRRESALPPRTATPLLDGVRLPADLRKLSEKQLPLLAEELRAEIIRVVSRTGGHLGANLGVVELTLALHYVFDTPRDRLIWDVSHQSYVHKILTGRRSSMHTLRQAKGLSGFASRGESVFDSFGAAHSSTSISAALGFAAARDLRDRQHRIIAVIGDGAMSAGMAYEAMNNAGSERRRLLVVLNDNDMSIAPPVGAMSGYLSRLISSRSYLSLRSLGRRVARRLPLSVEISLRRVEEFVRGAFAGGTLFEELGFLYIGPVDGHRLEHLLPVFKNLARNRYHGPVLLHCVTQKGKGYKPAEAARDKYHGVAKFDIASGKQQKSRESFPKCQSVFASALVKHAREDSRIVAVTAAMPSGTGLDAFAKHFPERTFDVGIAEQHAITFCAAMACEGLRPFAAIYSTFLQRAYDQIVHDVAIQSLPVRFAIDRAGVVGADGVTHQGSYDIVFLSCLPGFVLMAPSDACELGRMVATAVQIDDRPSALRYPRGSLPERLCAEGSGVSAGGVDGEPLLLGRGRILRQGHHVAILSYGAPLAACLEAASAMEAEGVSATVADARFAKPLDTDLLLQLARHHVALFSVEEGAIGGFSAAVAHFLSCRGIFDKGLIFRPLHFPDSWLQQDSPENQRKTAGLDSASIATRVLRAFRRDRPNSDTDHPKR